ncbi:MAG TPA: hypothetical protein VFI14_10525, partial [Chryseosolibacter sp.]|nr:hypothetical protein [Chryseosolibacter sp.]
KGMSTRGEAGRGYGISGTIGMLNDLGGRFLLISGDGTFQDTKEASFTVDNPRSIAWPGCLVIIRIPTIMPAGFNVLKYYS